MPLLLAAVTGLTVQVFRGSFEPFLVLVGTAVGLLVVGRQVVALVENRLLTARLQATVTDLAQRERPLIEALLRELAVADGLRRHLQADEDSPQPVQPEAR